MENEKYLSLPGVFQKVILPFFFFLHFILFFEVGVILFSVTLKAINEKMSSCCLEFKVQRTTLPFQRKYLLKIPQAPEELICLRHHRVTSYCCTGISAIKMSLTTYFC